MHLHFDCFSGISGDMTLGACVDLGVPVSWLNEQLASLPLTGFNITVSGISRNGIHATNLFVHDDIKAHPMDYTKISLLIENSPFSERVKRLSLDIFERIADAESKIHGCAKEKVHFHEVGAIDSIVDIVGTALCMEYLDVESVTASAIPLGSGFVTCSHGTIPVPAPATVEILKGIPVYSSGVKKEIVTPTGAAIISTLARSFGDIPEMVINKTGYGSGKRDLEDRPNLLRIISGDIAGKSSPDETISVVETTIDDMNPEIFGFLMDRLFDDGALDVYWQPVYMKKNRPGIVATVLCDNLKAQPVTDRILTETTTSGVRIHTVKRKTLKRQPVDIETRFGTIRAKEITNPDGSIRIVPEYEICRAIALEQDLPVRHVMEEVAAKGLTYGQGVAKTRDS